MNKKKARQPMRDSNFYDTIWEDERRFMRVLRSTDKNGEFLRMYLEIGNETLVIWNRIDITDLFLFLAKNMEKLIN